VHGNVIVSSDEQAQLLLDDACYSGQSFSVRGIHQARWSAFGAGRSRWHTLVYVLLSISLMYW